MLTISSILHSVLSVYLLCSFLSGVDALLLRLYEDINEPDSIAAVVKLPRGTAQLRLSNHACTLPNALQGCDQALQYSNAAGYSLPAQGYHNLEQPSHDVLGLVAALQRLGCDHIDQQCYQMNGHGACITSNCSTMLSKDARAELHCELAWRLGRWDDSSNEPIALPPATTHRQQQQGSATTSHLCTQMIAQSRNGGGNLSLLDSKDMAGFPTGFGGVGGGGFHATLLGMLQALQSDNACVVQDLLQGATMGAVERLTSMGSESVGET